MIFTLDGRGNVLLPFIFDTLELKDEECTSMIQELLLVLQEKLLRKGIEYSKLKSALIPVHKGKTETAFIFDCSIIKDAWYGNMVFEHLLPALNKDSTYSILEGDIFADGIPLGVCKEIIFEGLVQVHPSTFQHPSQYYVVYINNLSAQQQDTIIEALQNLQCFTGYVDMTFSSRLKTLLAYCLTCVGIKYQNIMLLPHEDDREDSEDINNCGYPFENYGFTAKSINEIYFSLFLSYKIEATFADPEDLKYSMNAICSSMPLTPVFKLPIFIPDEKIAYLKENKTGIMEKLGLEECSTEKLTKLISDHITRGYFYNLEYLETYNVPKFNLSLELKTVEGKMRKVLVSLKYSMSDKRMEFITMY